MLLLLARSKQQWEPAICMKCVHFEETKIISLICGISRYVICKESHRQIILLGAVYLNQLNTDLFALL